MERGAAILLASFLAACAARAAAAPVVCPQWTATEGDTATSIAAALGLEVGALQEALRACGQDPKALPARSLVCLPGAELPGCANVAALPGAADPRCKFYILPAGESVASAAAALNLYLPDLLRANIATPAVAAGTLRAGDLLLLPTWDVAVCGALPRNEIELSTFAAPPPPRAAPPPGGAPRAEAPSPGAPLEELARRREAGAEVRRCRAARARPGDVPADLAAAFGVALQVLLDLNPDLAGGATLRAGGVVRLPPTEPPCDAVDLVEVPGAPAGEAAAEGAEGPGASEGGSSGAAADGEPRPPGAAVAEVVRVDGGPPLPPPPPRNRSDADAAAPPAPVDSFAPGVYGRARAAGAGGPSFQPNIVSDEPGTAPPPPARARPALGITLTAVAAGLLMLAFLAMMSAGCWRGGGFGTGGGASKRKGAPPPPCGKGVGGAANEP
jgi:hypothetical protein